MQGFFGQFRRFRTRIFNLRKIVFVLLFFILPQSATQILCIAGHDFLLHLVAATSSSISDPTRRIRHRGCLRPFREVRLQRENYFKILVLKILNYNHNKFVTENLFKTILDAKSQNFPRALWWGILLPLMDKLRKIMQFQLYQRK